MARTDLKLKSKDNSTGRDMTTTITHVNENANKATLLEFGQKLNNLTVNVYEQTDRVQTINVDTEDVPINKQTPTLSFVSNSPQHTISENNLIIPPNQILMDGEPLTADILRDGYKLWGVLSFVNSGMFNFIGELNGNYQLVFTFPTGTTLPRNGYNVVLFLKPPTTSKYTPAISNSIQISVGQQ